MRKIKVPFRSFVPGSEIPEGVKLAVTTGREKQLIAGIELVLLEEIENDPVLAKQKVMNKLHPENGEPLVVGVDPGRRIGVVGYYGNSEIYGEVLNSADEAIDRILKLLRSVKVRRVVRIGNGDTKLAQELAGSLTARAGKGVQIEIVDERGTTMETRPNRRGARDVRSARLIAFRHGWPYTT